MLVHLFLERVQYVSGLKGHVYDLDSCMSVDLLENCPLLDSLKPMELVSIPLNYTHARIRKLER